MVKGGARVIWLIALGALRLAWAIVSTALNIALGLAMIVIALVGFPLMAAFGVPAYMDFAGHCGPQVRCHGAAFLELVRLMF